MVDVTRWDTVAAAGSEPSWVLRGFARGGRRDAVTGGWRSHREHLHQPRRSRQLCGALGGDVTDQGRAERGNQALAVEYAGRGIRSNAVALGAIRTPMHDPAAYDTLATLHPVGRLGEVDDVVDAVLYLQNAGFVTGAIPHVDGGQSAGH